VCGRVWEGVWEGVCKVCVRSCVYVAVCINNLVIPAHILQICILRARSL
jgi:hypothetical protein